MAENNKKTLGKSNKSRRELSDAEVKKKLISILRYFNEVCRKNGIKYSLDGGSLIGAIRHKGIIPWDDDIDVGLRRKEFEKVTAIIKKQPDPRFHLFMPGDEGYPFPFAKIVATDTYVEEKGFKEIPGYGVFMDIFVYHNLPNNPLKRIFFWQNIRFLKNGIWAQRRAEPVSKFYGQAKIAYFVSNIFRINCVKKFIKKYAKLPDRQTKIICHNWPGYSRKREFQKNEYFNDYIDVDFEGIKAMAFKDYDPILRGMYGDYMKLPPKEKQKSNHDLIAFHK